MNTDIPDPLMGTQSAAQLAAAARATEVRDRGEMSQNEFLDWLAASGVLTSPWYRVKLVDIRLAHDRRALLAARTGRLRTRAAWPRSCGPSRTTSACSSYSPTRSNTAPRATRAGSEAMLQEVAYEHSLKVNEKARAKANARYARRPMDRLNLGEYVMMHTQRDQSARKYLPNWTGPHQVVEVLNEHRYVVENVVTQALTKVHSSFLAYYDDSALDVTPSLREQAAFDT
jgi:hypothetical protein